MPNLTAAYPCPKCGYNYTKSDKARPMPHGYRRERKCLQCKTGFVTYEILAADYQFLAEFKRWTAAQRSVTDE